jgi:hypothetical protein
MRITTNGERSEISTKLSVEKRLWDNKKERAKGNSTESIRLKPLTKNFIKNEPPLRGYSYACWPLQCNSYSQRL